MPQDAGNAFYRCAMTAPMSLFYIFGRNINDSHYYYTYSICTKITAETFYFVTLSSLAIVANSSHFVTQ